MGNMAEQDARPADAEDDKDYESHEEPKGLPYAPVLQPGHVFQPLPAASPAHPPSPSPSDWEGIGPKSQAFLHCISKQIQSAEIHPLFTVYHEQWLRKEDVEDLTWGCIRTSDPIEDLNEFATWLEELETSPERLNSAWQRAEELAGVALPGGVQRVTAGQDGQDPIQAGKMRARANKLRDAQAAQAEAELSQTQAQRDTVQETFEEAPAVAPACEIAAMEEPAGLEERGAEEATAVEPAADAAAVAEEATAVEPAADAAAVGEEATAVEPTGEAAAVEVGGQKPEPPAQELAPAVECAGETAAMEPEVRLRSRHHQPWSLQLRRHLRLQPWSIQVRSHKHHPWMSRAGLDPWRVKVRRRHRPWSK